MAAAETGTYISDLDSAKPVGQTDAVSVLDDHDRLIKSTIKNTFPNIDGAMTATEDELNYNAGVTPGTVTASKTVIVDGSKAIDVLTIGTATIGTATITVQLDGAGEELIPAGTVMAFYAATAPNAGWVISDTHTNKMLRVVSTGNWGTGSGGSDSPIQMTGAQVPQHTHDFTGDAVAAHAHVVYGTDNTAGDGGSQTEAVTRASSGTGNKTSATGGGHTPTGTTDNNGSNATWDPYFVNLILCAKQ